MATIVPPTKRRFTPFALSHKSKIIPLLGDNKIADMLEESVSDEDIHQYEEIKHRPVGIRAILKAHQLEGISFLLWLRKNNAHGILADEMGLGKTLQILSFFELVKNMETEDRRPFLVVCPLSVLSCWQNEVDTWTTLRVVQWYGDSEKRKSTSQMVKSEDFDVVLTTYETVVADHHRLSRIGRWKCVVLDEGQRIKSFTTKLSSTARSLATDQRLILTGTPIQNDLTELWSMVNWLYPDLFVKETQQYWKDAFSLSSGHVDPGFLNNAKEFLEVIMLRRLKDSTAAGLELPAKREVILQLPLTQEQKRLYLEVITGCVDTVEDSANNDSHHALQTPPQSPGTESFTQSHSTRHDVRFKGSRKSITNILMELRKVCIHPLPVENFHEVNDDADTMIQEVVHTSSKFIALEKLLNHEVLRNNKKMLIFAGFDYALDCCQALLASMNISHLRLDGSTPYAIRRYNVHQFQKKDDHRVFVIATRAGGEGITLTAAEIIVFLDLDWNPQVMAQAEARSHRIGQTRPVTVIKMCTRGTVEAQMLHRVNKKLCLASKIITDAPTATSEMSPAESLESDGMFSRRLISRSFDSVNRNPSSVNALMSMDWKEVVENFRSTTDVDDEPTTPIITPPSPSADSFNERERLWLTQSTRIRTGLFNGMMFSRPRASLKGDIPADLDPSQRRLGKNRTVYDAESGYYIDKQSTLCVKGEAVPTMTNGSIPSIKAVSNTGFQHLEACIICARPKNLEECMYCPEVYHQKCIERQKEPPKTNFFHNAICTKHRCVTCGLTANKVGGLLLSCTDCPWAYCIACADLNSIKSIDGELPQYEALGYTPPRHTRYITCGDCVAKAREGERKRTMTPSDGRILPSTKRARQSDVE